MNICDQAGYDPQAINSCDGNRNAAPAVRVQNTDSPDVPRIVVIGCSGHARVVVDILHQNHCEVVGLLDTYKSIANEVLGHQVLGTMNPGVRMSEPGGTKDRAGFLALGV